jgi:hypothetical protein
MKFIRVIEAEQYFPGKETPGVTLLPSPSPFEESFPVVTTMYNHVLRIEPGDWIIKESDGIHYYPCKPEIFDKLYERLQC